MQSEPAAGAERSSARAVCWLLLGSLALQLLLTPTAGWKRDLYWFGTWMRTATEHGVAHVSEHVWCDYPPGYLYLLRGVSFLWTYVTGLEVPADGTLAMLFLLKALPMLAHLLCGWVLFLIARPRLERRATLLVVAAWAFNPAMLFNNAVWGQADVLVGLMLVVSVWAVAERRPALGFAVLSAAILTKFQAVVFLPILLVATWRLQRGGGIRGAYVGSSISGLVLLLPLFWAGRAATVFETAFGAAGRYPYISMNALNVWWLLKGTNSLSTSDALRLGNALLSYRSLGTIMLGVATLLILVRLWRDLQAGSQDPAAALFEACALEAMAFYLLPTEMHERYIVPAIPLLAAGCIFRRRTWWVYVPMSLAVCLSLATALNANYPDVLGPLNRLFPEGRGDTIVLSVVFVVLFLVYLLWANDHLFTKLAPASIVGAVLLVTAALHAPLGGTVRLCEWQPVEVNQAWGQLQHDRSVEGNRLSVYSAIFRHGIGTHAKSRLKYHLNGAFRTFDTAFGADGEAARGQNMRFRIRADDEVCFDSGRMRASGPARHVSVDVEGAEFLTLEVLEGGDGMNSDHADWLEPLLYR